MQPWLRSSILSLAFASTLNAQTPGPRFTAQGELERPANYREWVFLTAGLGMTYGPNAPAAGRPAPFSNVFVSPAAYRAFMQTGQWPDGTMFVLEIRRALENISINNGGRTQGEIAVIEASVKDTARFPAGGWAYFDFGPEAEQRAAVASLPRTAECYACHSAHGAVEWTFTQFYPEQFKVAQQRGTVRADYDPTRKAQ